VRDSYKNRKKFADQFAPTMLHYLNLHQGVIVQDCKELTSVSDLEASIAVYPNVLNAQQSVQIQGADLSGKYFEVYNLLGQRVEKGQIEFNNEIHFSNHFENGVHFLSINTGQKMLSFQLFVISW
jgi:hypothetical protein